MRKNNRPLSVEEIEHAIVHVLYLHPEFVDAISKILDMRPSQLVAKQCQPLKHRDAANLWPHIE